MRSRLSLILFLLWLVASYLTFGALPAFPSAPTMFVDYDGDGFDDKAPDDDTDGIPDELERHGFISATFTQLKVLPVFSGSNEPSSEPNHPSSGEAFGRRKFGTRAVSKNRLDFDAGFSSNLGPRSGLGSGGGCAGGVCF
jgi:hypothetical protein